MMSRNWLLILMLLSGGVLAEGDNDVIGYWASPTSIFEIQVIDGALQGEVRALLNPLYLPDEDSGGRTGLVRTDDNNPDAELTGRPILGLPMFSEYQLEGGRWRGKIYDPESGNTYQSHMKINGVGDLEIRGYIGMPMFGRTAIFAPVQRCTINILAMTTQLAIENPCASQQDD
jgi:uncharacterized protein (DUF2147 family)